MVHNTIFYRFFCIHPVVPVEVLHHLLKLLAAIFRQDPGEENSMASVKINFLSPFGIYLHDTPTKSLFTTGARYLSSGCVRVEEVSTLINWVLNGQAGISPEMAIRLEKAGWSNAGHWLRLQTAHDLAQARSLVMEG